MSDTNIYSQNGPAVQAIRRGSVSENDPLLEDLRDFRLTLLDHGYEPIPSQGKHRLPLGWTTGAITAQRIIDETRFNRNKLNTSIRCGRSACVDNDLVDPLHAAAANEIAEYFLGITPLKRYGSKGAALIYYNPDPITKITVTAVNNVRLFEILGQGQQYVAFGAHPKGMDYRWESESPYTVHLDELPRVTCQQLNGLVDNIRDLLTEIGYKLKSIKDVHEVRAAVESNNPFEDIPALCHAALQVVPNDCDRDEWVAMCFAIRDSGLTFADWADWCSKWSGTNTQGAMTRAWNSCSPRAITYRTLLKAADLADPNWRRRYFEEKKAQRVAKWADQIKNWKADLYN